MNMPYFLNKLASFIALPVILWIVILGTAANKKIHIPGDRTVLMLGDSHVESAINDTILSNLYNLAESADSYLATYLKLQKVHKDNPNIDTIYLSYRPRSLSKRLDRWYDIDYADKFETLWFYDYSEISSLYGLGLVVPKILSWETFKASIKYVVYKSLSQYSIGGYRFLVRDNLEKDLRRWQDDDKSYVFEKNEGEISGLQVTYLTKIIKYCAENSLELILFDTPEYIDTKSGVPQLENYYEQHLSHLTFFDYSDLKLDKTSYGDVGHLNYRGAKTFSEYLKQNGMDACQSVE